MGREGPVKIEGRGGAGRKGERRKKPRKAGCKSKEKVEDGSEVGVWRLRGGEEQENLSGKELGPVCEGCAVQSASSPSYGTRLTSELGKGVPGAKEARNFRQSLSQFQRNLEAGWGVGVGCCVHSQDQGKPERRRVSLRLRRSCEG